MKKAHSIIKNGKSLRRQGIFFAKNPQQQNSFFDSHASLGFFNTLAATIHRKCDHCSEEEQVERKVADNNSHHSGQTHIHLGNLNHSGQSLPMAQQQFFGRRMNHDFSEVKIHTDKEAAQSASELNAQAYTYQNHIVFDENKYQPSTTDGKKLLSHELFHVIQQANNGKVYRQEQPPTEWIPPDVGPGLPVPIPEDLMPLDPVERERWREQHRDALSERQDQLRTEVVPFLERNDASGLMARLRSLTRRQAFDLLSDEQFMGMLQTRFQGVALWSIFSVMLTRGGDEPLAHRLDVAVLSGEAQMVVDLLTLMRSPTTFMNVMRRRLLRIVVPQIFGGNVLQPQMLDLLQDIPASATRHLRFTPHSAHYEQDEQGQMVLQEFGGTREIDFRTTATQMRVVVPMDFVQPGNHLEPFLFIGGTLPSILDNWLATIQQVWNNKFYLYNGRQNLLLVFVPIAVHAGQNHIEVHTNDSERCPGISQAGRAQALCYFTSDSGNVIAHEFGHLIGAADEYNLPATAAEIPASIRSQMSAEDIRVSTVEGITRTRQAAVEGGQDIPDSLMSQPEASQHVYARHIQRLVNAINAQLPGGVPPYQIRRVGSM